MGDYITQQDLPPNMVKSESDEEVPLRLKEAVAFFEKQHIIKALEKTSNNKEETANLLGISLSSLYRKMDELKIDLT
jgi:transcriptional regulator with PAS, ATPase and Fis domain